MPATKKQTLSGLLHSQCKKFSQKTFILWRDSKLSYSELDEEANKIANTLMLSGVKKGEKVALLMENCILYVSLFFGITRAGAVLVPINPQYSKGELTIILNHSDATTLIYAEKFQLQINSLRSELKQIKRFISTGEVQNEEIQTLKLLMKGISSKKPDVNVKPEDLAAIIYTSGTTGEPKGVMLTNWNYVVNAYQACACKKMKPEDRFLTALPLCHVAPQVGAILSHLCAGGSVALLEKFSPNEFLAAIDRYKATAFGAVPTIYNIFLALTDKQRFDFSSLRYCNTSASPMPPEVGAKVQSEFRASLLESYGLTEGTCGSACNPIEGVRKPGSVGLPLEGQEFGIVDESGKRLPPHKIGELIIRGPNIMKGYYKNPEATSQTIRDGWLYTGDLGYLDEEGYLFLVGRKKELIIRGGVNIYPADIERVIYRHEGVQEVVVVGLPDPIWGESVHAAIIQKPSLKINDDEIWKLCEASLTEYKVPTSISYHETFPRTSTNKIKRRLLVADLEQSLM
jgi:long-chain acyl-CoA synthetase